MLKSVSLETGLKLKIPDPSSIVFQNQKCLLDMFNIKCDYLDRHDLQSIRYVFSEPDHTHFWPQVFNTQDNTDFYGFFQNYNYFKKYEKEVVEDLSFNDELQEFASDYVNSLKKNNEQIVSLHFRRGDNTDGTGGIVQDYYGRDNKYEEDSVFGKYCELAMKHYDGKNVKFLVFSGGSRSGMNHNQGDIDWCKQNLKGDNFLFSEGNSDIQDFAIMTNCDHNVVSHSTSFGYWASILNKNPNKIIIAPKNYTIPDDGRAQRGFYPEHWIKF